MSENLKKHNKVVIKETKKGNVQYFISILAFIVVGIFLWHLGSLSTSVVELIITRVAAIAALVFFGACGLVALFTKRQPKLVISDEGILIPHLFGKEFVHWDNVDKFEAIEQVVAGDKLKSIGIFSTDPNAAGNIKPDAMTQLLLLRNRLPTWMIEFAYSPEQIEEVMGILEEFHNEHKSRCAE